MSKKTLLIENHNAQLTLTESTGNHWKVRGEFGRVDVPTANGRVYSKKLTEREIGRLRESLDGHRTYGELDHPTDGRTLLTRVSHYITDLQVEDDGRVIGEAVVMDTPNGRILKAIVEAGGQVGVSSRGKGSVRPGPDGTSVVGEDFQLDTYDFVANPAMKTAYPEMFVEEDLSNGDWVQIIESEFPDIIEDIEKSVREKITVEPANTNEEELKEQFERRLAEEISKLRLDVAGDLKEEFEKDPQIGAAKNILGEIARLVQPFTQTEDEAAIKDAMKAQDVEIAKLKEETENWQNKAKEAAYSLAVERSIGSHSHKDVIRTIIGSVMEYESLEALKSALAEAKESIKNLPDPKAEEDAKIRADIEKKLSEQEEEHRAELQEAQDRVDSLEAELDRTKASLKKSNEMLERCVETIDELEEQINESGEKIEALEDQLQESRLNGLKASVSAGYANRREVQGLVESAQSEAEVQRIAASAGATTMSDSRLEEIRRRYQRGTVSNGESLHEGSENTRSAGKNAELRADRIGFTQSFEDIIRMSGD